MSAGELSRAENGETLAELIVAIAIIGLAMVGIVGAVGAAATTSTINREQGTAENVLRQYAEFVQSQPFDCAAGYPPLEFDAEGRRTSVAGVPVQFVASVAPGTVCAGRLQQLHVQVVSTSNRVATPIAVGLDLMKRDPS